MRFTLAIFFSVIVFIALPAAAQSTPTAAVQSFYKWYLGELNAERYPRPSSPKVQAAVSTRLKGWFRSKEGREWDADYFINAQDFEKDWQSSIVVSKVNIRGSNADMRLTLGPKSSDPNSMGQRVLKIKMVKEAGGWKIDHVDNY
jgi:hypothetical protein